MNGPSPSVTCPFWTLIAPPPRPDNAFTSCAWATELSLVQRRANASLVTTLFTWEWMKPLTAPEIEGAKVRNTDATRGRSRLARASAALSVNATTLICVVISVVILSVSARWIGGFLASGAMFATYLLVSDTWLAVQTESTDKGASTQPSTISSVATGPRQPIRRRRR